MQLMLQALDIFLLCFLLFLVVQAVVFCSWVEGFELGSIMPALVNSSVENVVHNSGSVYSVDSSLLCSISSQLDLYVPSSKRARISFSFPSSASMPNTARTSIEVLLDECLFEVFRRLRGAQARSSSACVSKRWLRLVSNVRKSETCNYSKNEGGSPTRTMPADGDEYLGCDGYLTRCLEGRKATDIRLAALSVGTTSRGGLGKLEIRGTSATRGVTDDGLKAIACGSPSLRVLSLWNVPSIGDEGLLEIAKECRLLEKIDLCQCPSITNKGLIAIADNSPNLTSVVIESCPNIGNESLQAIGRSCRNLQSVSIRDCPLVGDPGVANLVFSASSVLTKLKLQNLSIGDTTLAVIGCYGKALTSLVLIGLQEVSMHGLSHLGKHKGLEKLLSLTITSCRGATDDNLLAIGEGCHSLKQMYLRRCSFLTDNGIVNFAKASRCLESLQLEECNRITLFGVIRLLSNCGSQLKSLALLKCMGIKDTVTETSAVSPCESLHSLSFKSCPGFGSSSLAVVGKLCPNLQNIDLSGLSRITDSGLLPLVESCCEAGLVKVNLSGCLNLTDEVVSNIAKMHGGTLEVLHLDGCTKVTDASLVAVADNCLVLNDLDVSKCAITNSGVATLSSGGLLNLEILSISGCSKISDKSMPYLLELGNNLIGLNLKHCNSISTSIVEMLEESLWKCNILT